jgi:hypothetical protein
VRWRRYGKDRLYIKRADGVRLGWCDLQTGNRYADRPEERPQVEAAIDTWLAGEASGLLGHPPGVAVPQARSASPDLVSEQHPESHEDLAGRRAGIAARAQAVALKDAAPVRTGLARLLGVKTDERAWRIGADGEEKVAAVLEKLARKDPR